MPDDRDDVNPQDEHTLPMHPSSKNYVEPPVGDDDTADMDIASDEDVPFKLPPANPPHRSTGITSGQEVDDYNRGTMPAFREPGADRPELTLPGSGGLDPNPDFGQSTLPNQSQPT